MCMSPHTRSVHPNSGALELWTACCVSVGHMMAWPQRSSARPMQTTETLVSDEAIQAISESDESPNVGGLYVRLSACRPPRKSDGTVVIESICYDEGASRDTSCAAGGTSAPAAARLGRRRRRAQRQRCAFQGWPIACRWRRGPRARSRAFGHRLRSEARALLTFLLPCSRVESGGRRRSKAGPCGAVVSARDAHAALLLRRAWLGRRATA